MFVIMMVKIEAISATKMILRTHQRQNVKLRKIDKT